MRATGLLLISFFVLCVSVPEKSASAAELTCSVDVTELRTKGNQRGGGQVGTEDHRVRIDFSWTGWTFDDFLYLTFETPEHEVFYPHHVKWWGDPGSVYHRVAGDRNTRPWQTIIISMWDPWFENGSVSIEVGHVHSPTSEGYPFFLDNFTFGHTEPRYNEPCTLTYNFK